MKFSRKDMYWWKEKFLQYEQKNKVYHGLFWLAFLIILVITDRNEIQITLLKEIVNVAFFAAIVYINLIILIPQYLKTKKYVSYAFFLILMVLIISPIKTMALYLLFPGRPGIQQGFIDNQTFIFLSNLFIAISSTVFQILSAWQSSEGEMKELEYKTTQTELNFLKSQINPHFLFNTLNNLYALTLKKSDAAPETVLKLSEIMRYMLYECNERKVALAKEINYLKNYIELEKLRLSNKFEIKLDIIGPVANQSISPLLLTPFIENAFKHGINKTLKDGFIAITIEIHELDIQLFISNSKGDLGPKQDYGKKSGGIGLANVKRRLDILYPNEHTLLIQDDPDKYSVHLTLKLDK